MRFVVKTKRAELQSPLTPGQTQGIQATRLRVVMAQSGEDMTTLCRRESCAWTIGRLAVLNHLSITHRFNGGERVKIARKEDWTPPQP